LLSHENLNVIVIGRRELAKKYDNFKRQKRLTHIQTDLVDEKSANLIKSKLANIRLDYIIFSVATEEPLKNFSEVSENTYDYAFLLNVKSLFFLTQMLIPNLNLGARILFLTSRLSALPEVGSLVYCMTKSALEVFSAGLNKELSGKILSSSIIPGVVDTEMQKRLREADCRIFPNAHVYQKMQPKLLSVKVVSEKIVSYLRNSSDEVFCQQRVNLFEAAFNLNLENYN